MSEYERACERIGLLSATAGPDGAAAIALVGQVAHRRRLALEECRAVFGQFDLAKLHAENAYLHAIVRHAMDTVAEALADAEKDG